MTMKNSGKSNDRYFPLRDMITKDRKLSPSAKLAGQTLLSLSRPRGNATVSNKKLIELSGVSSVRVLQRATSELVGWNYFTVTQRRGELNRYQPNYDLVTDLV